MSLVCLKNRTKRQQKRYKDTCQIDRLIKNNGWDTKYNLLSTWECEEPILKKVRFEKGLTPYPHFIVYDFEVISAPFNEHPTDNLTYLSSHISISLAVHDTLSKEPKYLVDENPERLTERFIEVLTEKQEAIAADVLKQHHILQIFKCFQARWKNNGGNGLIRFLYLVLVVVNMTLIWRRSIL